MGSLATLPRIFTRVNIRSVAFWCGPTVSLSSLLSLFSQRLTRFLIAPFRLGFPDALLSTAIPLRANFGEPKLVIGMKWNENGLRGVCKCLKNGGQGRNRTADASLFSAVIAAI